MFKKFIIVIVGFAAVVFCLGAVKVAQIQKVMSVSHVPPAVAVTTYDATQAEWHPRISAIGTLAPVQGATIGADADGIIVTIAVESGASVKQGDLLVELDTSVEKAQLAASEARADLSKINLDRIKGLLDREAVSKAEFDTSDATHKQSLAEVGAIKAQIARKQVRAPFSGRVGIRHVNVGQFVARGAALMPLQKLDPIYVNFNVPQRSLASLTVGQKVLTSVDSFEQPFEAKVTAIDSEVDSATRNISVQATLANPKEQLRAGMFARVEVELSESEPTVVIPSTSIAYASYGNTVFIVETIKGEDGKEYLGVRQQPVKLGASRGDLISILEGVKPGEKVVTAGVFKLRNGMHVQINNASQPSSSAEPKPANT